MRAYRLYLRSFAPWPAFGGVLPGPSSIQTDRGTYVNNLNYDGDDRGFPVDTDNTRVTARINFFIDVIPAHKQFGTPKIWCNQSKGPWMLIGPTGRKTASPKADLLSYVNGDQLHLDVSYAASLPLVVGAPDIDAGGVFDFRLSSGPQGPEFTVDTDISGDQFPAFETFIDDQAGNKVFLGGFAPESRSPVQLARLFGNLNRPREIYFRSSVRISLSPTQSFQRVVGTFGTQLRAPFLNWPGSSLTLPQWNDFIMKSVPMPIDGWLY